MNKIASACQLDRPNLKNEPKNRINKGSHKEEEREWEEKGDYPFWKWCG